MKRYFKEQPFYLWAVGTGMLVGSYSMFYLLIRPDLYHVPIVASAMFATGGLWLYLAGLNRPKKRWGCMRLALSVWLSRQDVDPSLSCLQHWRLFCSGRGSL